MFLQKVPKQGFSHFFAIFDLLYIFGSKNYHPGGWGPRALKPNLEAVNRLGSKNYHPSGSGPRPLKYNLEAGSAHRKIKKWTNNKQVHFYFFPHMKRQLNPYN